MSDLTAIAAYIKEACERVLLEKESLIYAFLLQNPECSPENIRFCQQQVYDQDGNPYFKYWIELKRQHTKMPDMIWDDHLCPTGENDESRA